MKIALITDTHYGIRNDNSVFYDYFKNSSDWFFETIKQEGIGEVIHLGDLVDRRKYINFVTSSRMRKDFLQPLDDLGIKTHIIAGNHDEFYKDTHEINSLRELVGNSYENISIYSTPTTISVDGCEILLMPWINESKESKSNALEAIAGTNAEILMGHLDLKGFEEHKGSISDHGLDSDIFGRFHSVYSGHFHHRSTIGNISYLGAFTEHSWSDFNDDRGFSIFDTETREVTFYKNPYTMFKMVGYDDVTHYNIIEYINHLNYEDFRNTYVKIVCANKTNPYAFDMMVDNLYKVNPISVSVIEDLSTFTETNESSEIDQSEDTPTLLGKYIDSLTLVVNGDRMKRLMTSIYSEALSYNMEI